MLTKVQVWQRLNEMRVNKTLTEIEIALNEIDQQAIFNSIRQNYVVQVWDKATPINGVSAETILSREDMPAGSEIYLIYVNGQLRFLQPHDPFQAGLVAMTTETAVQLGNQHADQLAWQEADQKIFEAVLEKVLG